MSYDITPIAVSLEQVQGVIGVKRTGGFLRCLLGSPIDRLIRTIKWNYAHRFEQDEVYDEDEPSLEKALGDLLAGAELAPTFGHKYAYALELVCDHFGEFLDNSAWSAMRLDWAEHVHEAMTQADIDEEAISLNDHLMFRGPPIPIPVPADFPAIGFLRRNEIGNAATALDAADLSSLDEETRESITQIQLWLERCNELKCDLVCFYY